MRQGIKDRIADIGYFLYKKGLLHNRIRVYSVDETLNQLLHTQKSLVRFGDGEITMIRGRSLKLQSVEPALIDDLKRILQYEYDDLMVSIPDIFEGVEQYHVASRQFWKDHLLFCRRIYNKFCNQKRIYCNTSVSRCYYAFENKTSCGDWFTKIMQVWAGKHIVVVEGERSHCGVGNDLFDTTLDVKRIIGPSSNAYQKLEEIKTVCVEFPKDRLFLLALGAAAKPLAEYLFLEGYRVIDIGNLDMEYEWYLRRAVKKEPVGKHGIIGRQANEAAGYQEYLKQIYRSIEL